MNTLKYKILAEDIELVHRQLHCVKHLCSVVSDLAEAKIRMLPAFGTKGDLGHHLVKMGGSWSHGFMEWVAEMLNNMDAVDAEQDRRWAETFTEAAARWKNLTDELNGHYEWRGKDFESMMSTDQGTPPQPSNAEVSQPEGEKDL